MPPLPVISGRDAVRVLAKFGWQVDRQRGSHIVMTRSGSLKTLSIPDHRELDRGLLRSLIRAAGLTVEEFCAAI
jgi:predicted RNA binding protein YcfA (HicA-like mRNA interferase family)